MKEKNIIVTVDDFGISKKASSRILELAKGRKLDQVEVMMSKNIKQEQARELLDFGVKIDIHFHLKGDVLDKWQDRKEEYKEGNLKRIFIFLRDYFFSKDRVGETEAEWYFQLSDFKKLFGRNPDGVSSHEHIHFFPAYFRLILEIAREHQIDYVRFGRGSFKNGNGVSIILNWLKKIDLKFFKKYHLGTSDYFVSFDWIKEKKDPLLGISQNKETELVFHPERDDEYNFLKSRF